MGGIAQRDGIWQQKCGNWPHFHSGFEDFGLEGLGLSRALLQAIKTEEKAQASA